MVLLDRKRRWKLFWAIMVCLVAMVAALVLGKPVEAIIAFIPLMVASAVLAFWPRPTNPFE